MYQQTRRFQAALRAQSTPGVLHLVLPFPPSANARWEHVGGRIVKRRRISQYEQEVAQVCLLQCVGIPRPLQPPYAMSLEVIPPEGMVRPDLDNTLKNLMDALVCAGVLVDDKHIEAMSLVYAPAQAEGAVQVHVWTFQVEEEHGDHPEAVSEAM